ncbi:ubiquitin carboxyl-terminal hydrolase 27 isoform X2 [Humulus lupulus]|uniref:ubiquitin carboxyl-terminal hydrolase 27 isoform X2 n=1 Tax=Humulus lupulus TaxID=3486 RepID=UPI002B40682C|nr:ubiquitin carboxyl-terminal hydrolase 27 isoform X2 [Humulus lupulus]
MKMQGEVKLNDFIHLFKHGIRTISRSNWVSASGFQISVAGLFGVAGFVLALRDGKLGKLSSSQWLLPKGENPQNLRLVPGLKNLGNNCFLNVILQALASCSRFHIFLHKAIEEIERSANDEELVDSLPLAVSLALLLQDLCAIGERRVVLNPRKVMLSMAQYIPNFNLTAQQDAAEAFLHLLSSLREEFADCYDPSYCSLFESCSSSCRIITPKRREGLNKQKRWTQSFIGPFNGILGSILTCQSCSSQISLNFESFHSLALSPVLATGANIMVGCSLEDCLKQFTVAEQVENYRCSSCWHIAGIRFLSAIGSDETEIEKLRTCSEQDFCDCRKFLPQDAFPWSNKFSHTLKQISIARSPKILCIHLKRVSFNVFGESFKLQGHISFPMILDLFSFMTSGVAIKSRQEIFQRGKMQPHYKQPSFLTGNFNIQHDTRNLNSKDKTKESFYSKDTQDIRIEESNIDQIGCCSETTHVEKETHSYNQVSMIHQSVPPSSLYRLVSVVEHFGGAGSGHYTIYRSILKCMGSQKKRFLLLKLACCFMRKYMKVD